MNKIVIPTPCSEDWSKMTPTEKGAFCQKCSLEVIDFTNKTPEEIRETLADRIGKKTCGHIGKIQLELANSNFHVWDQQSPQILRSKFLYACLMVFGMTLFTGCDQPVTGEMENDQETIDGGMETLTGDTVMSCDIDTTFDSDVHMSMGEMSVVPE